MSLIVGFYSTYEELKLERLEVPFVLSTRFYSTYEELKLRLLGAFPPVCLLFLQYLWGIET